MFAPVDHISWHQMHQLASDWALRLLFADELHRRTKKAQVAFDREYISPYDFINPTLVAGGNKRLIESSIFQEDIVASYILCELLQYHSPLVSTFDGRLMKLPEPIKVHADSLIYLTVKYPLREVDGLKRIFELFDSGHPVHLSNRFCFIDGYTGLVTVKNGAGQKLTNATGYPFGKVAVDRFINKVVAPYTGWSVVWRESVLPDSLLSFLDELGLVNPKWGLRGGPRFWTSLQPC